MTDRDMFLSIFRIFWLLTASILVFALPLGDASPTWLGVPAWMLYLASVVKLPSREDEEEEDIEPRPIRQI